jgi:hypothetical protein
MLYPNILVGGPSGYQLSTTPNMINTFVSNISDEGNADFCSVHVYSDYRTNSFFDTTFNRLSNCSEIILSEYNHGITSILNNTDYTQDVLLNSLYYARILNLNPNIANYYFTFSTEFSWNNAVTGYKSYYATKYHMFSESALDNEYTGPYNITQKYTRYAPAGGTVYNSTSDYDLIKVVSTKIGTTDNIIITNADTDSVNITLNTDNMNSNLLIDAQTGELYDTSSGSLSLGVMDAYEIKYLTTPTINLEGSTWYWENYLGENIRTATQNEINAYSTDHPVSAGNDNGFAKTVLNIMVGLFSMGVAFIGLFALKYFWDEGELTPMVLVTVFLLTLLGIVFIQILADLVVRQ